jgi:hypothetical protein
VNIRKYLSLCEHHLTSAASFSAISRYAFISVLLVTKGRQMGDAFKATRALRGSAGSGQPGEHAAAGLAMNAVSVLRISAAHSNSPDRESPKQDDAKSSCRPIGLLSFLEAENIRLRQAIVELWFDTMALREALKAARTLSAYVKSNWRGSRYGK